MKYCSKCKRLTDNNTEMYCIKCGAPMCDFINKEKTENIEYVEEIENIEDNEINEYNERPQKNSNIRGLINGLITVIIVSVMGQFSDNFTEYFSSIRDKHELEGYIEKMESYTPGVWTENEYVSEHFGFKFTTDENWVMMPEEDFKEMSIIFEGAKENYVSLWTEIFEEKKTKKELQEKFISSIYAEGEMGAYYVDENDNILGTILIGVFDNITNNDTTDWVEGVKDGFVNMGMITNPEDIITEEFVMADIPCTILKVNTAAEGLILNYICATKNNMTFLMTCSFTKDYEDVIMDSLLEQISSNNT